MNQKQAKRLRFLGKIFFVLYILFLLYFLIFSDWYGRTGNYVDYRYNLVLFQEIRRFYVYRDVLGPFAVFTNLVGNVLIFVPFGFFVALSSRTNGLGSACLYSLELSLCVEIFQFFTKVGSFDVDDLLLNTVGGVCGYVLFFICNHIRRRQQYGRGKRKSSKKKSHR